MSSWRKDLQVILLTGGGEFSRCQARGVGVLEALRQQHSNGLQSRKTKTMRQERKLFSTKTSYGAAGADTHQGYHPDSSGKGTGSQGPNSQLSFVYITVAVISIRKSSGNLICSEPPLWEAIGS